MNNPKSIKQKDAWTYDVPTFAVTNDGLIDGPPITIPMCRGNKLNEADPRQGGLFTETLLQVCKEYLEAVNKGDLASRETSMAITKIDEALMWLNRRAEDRKLRGVQGSCMM